MTPFKRYWAALDTEEKAKLADDLDTSVGYLKLIANGHRSPGHQFARRIKDRTGLSLKQLRPDIFGELRA